MKEEKKKRGPKIGSKRGPYKKHSGYKKKRGPKAKTDKQKKVIKDEKNKKEALANIQDDLCCGDCAYFNECKKEYDQKLTDTIDGCPDFDLSTRDLLGRYKKGHTNPVKGLTKGKRLATSIAERCGANGGKIVDFHFLIMTGALKASISERQESANWLANRFAGKDIIEATVDIKEQITVEQKIQGFVSLIAERRKSLPDASLNEAYKMDKDTVDAEYTVEKVKANVKGNVTSQVVDQIVKGIN